MSSENIEAGWAARSASDRALSLIEARLRIAEFAFNHSLDEVIQMTLDEVEALTGSTIGFFHFVDEDQRSLHLQTWSTNTLANMCKAEGKGSHYPVEEAGVWADCLRQRRPVVHNDYSSLPDRKGLPEGHAKVVRELTVPLFSGERVHVILGVGNKLTDYDDDDVMTVEMLATMTVDIVERKQTEGALRASEERRRLEEAEKTQLASVLGSAGDAILAVDGDGKIVMCNPATAKMFGYEEGELQGTVVHDLVPDRFRAAHPGHTADFMAGVLGDRVSTDVVAMRRDGSEFPCELTLSTFDHEGTRLVTAILRDTTERKRAEEAIVELNRTMLNERQRMFDRMVLAVEEERKKLAIDLHDGPIQLLTATMLQLNTLSKAIAGGDPNTGPRLKQIEETLGKEIGELRSMMAHLIPPALEENGLGPALNDLAADFGRSFGIEVEVDVRSVPRLVQAAEVALYRIAQEALTNAERHGSAERLRVTLDARDSRVLLVISDDGTGFDMTEESGHAEAEHFGMAVMKERAEMVGGRLSVESTVGKGTRVTASVPLRLGPDRMEG